ncbi:MAG: hypothetical protein II161_02070 [Erysipelotrichaceae bacterium]|nr:hypothetical protein [Erysipelotrichaceae bacterium]
MSKLTYIFVHGLSGWGSYDSRYEKMPYWGMLNGDLMVQLRELGYDCYAASVAPHDSAYDRACELYAQLAGTVTDYGRNHSGKYGHDRYGRDFSGKPLIEKFDNDTRLVLFGHSFGGATIRTFAHLMEHGLKEEAGEDSSPLFKGGMGNRIFALVTIAAPHNGTTAYDLYEDPDFDVNSVRIPLIEDLAGNIRGKVNAQKPLPFNDRADYDMHIDNALRLNEQLKLSDNVYYFSQPCEMSREKEDGTHVPIGKGMELMFRRSSRRIGAYKGKTRGGFLIDESWRQNDGLVNTVSACYPLYNDHKDFDPASIEKGKWNVFKTRHADHMALQGGLTKRTEVLPYYKEIIEMISSLK